MGTRRREGNDVTIVHGPEMPGYPLANLLEDRNPSRPVGARTADENRLSSVPGIDRGKTTEKGTAGNPPTGEPDQMPDKRGLPEPNGCDVRPDEKIGPEVGMVETKLL